MTTSAVQLQCSICKQNTTNITVLNNGKIFYHCSNCNFSGLDSAFFLNPSEEKSRYDNHENNIENQGYVDMFERFIDFTISELSVRTILDYGSGPGPVLAELLSKKGYKVSTYDPFYAPKKFENESFDLITSTEVFEHFNNPLEEIKKLISLVKPNGYISVMTRFCPELDKFKSWFYKDDDTHVSFYSPKTFEYIAKLFNLKIIKHDNFQYILLQKSN
jgi:SAM-dependent methyltransferase